MLAPHEFKRTRAARPRPDLGGDDLADLGTTCWCVGRISTDKHLSIGNAHAVLPKKWFVLAASGGPCGPPSVAVSVWLAVLAAASTGRRRGRPPWWRPSVWLVYWLAVLAAGGRPPCWRSVRGWCPSVAVVAVSVAAGGLSAVRWSTGPPWPFRGPWRPVWALCACLSFGSVPPPLVARRRWCAVLVLACLVCAVGGRGGRVAGRPCWCRWCRCHCAVPWPVARVAGRQCGPPCGGVLVVSLRRALLGRVPCPSVRAGVRRGGRWPCPSVLAGVLVCGRWLASVSCRIPWPWRPVWAVGGVGVRRWSLRPVWALFWALPTGWPCGPCQWWRRWLAVLALAVVLALSKNVGPWLAGGGPCAVLSWCGVRLPCWRSLLVSHQRRPWPPV